jgi:hypothetical protein
MQMAALSYQSRHKNLLSQLQLAMGKVSDFSSFVKT